MAIVAKMQAQSVTGASGSRWVPAEEGVEGAILIEDATGVDSYYGRPPWLRDATHVLLLPNTQASEQARLVAVSSKDDENDPNRDWASATPSATLEITIMNPRAWAYLQPGEEYRVTIEKIRGPRG